MSEDNEINIPPFGTELQPIDFVRFAERGGGAGARRREGARPALRAAWRIADRPALISRFFWRNDKFANVAPGTTSNQWFSISVWRASCYEIVTWSSD